MLTGHSFLLPFKGSWSTFNHKPCLPPFGQSFTQRSLTFKRSTGWYHRLTQTLFHASGKIGAPGIPDARQQDRDRGRAHCTATQSLKDGAVLFQKRLALVWVYESKLNQTAGLGPVPFHLFGHLSLTRFLYGTATYGYMSREWRHSFWFQSKVIKP